MSGHTNRNKRNGGNPRSRHGPPRQKGSDDRAGQPKSGAQRQGQVTQQTQSSDGPQGPRDAQEHGASHEQQTVGRHPGQGNQQPPRMPHRVDPALIPSTESPESPPVAHNAAKAEEETMAQHEHSEGGAPRGRASFAAAARGGHAYIPANNVRPGMNGHGNQHAQNGQNGQNSHLGGNGHSFAERHSEPMLVVNDDDDGDRTVPQTWRVERLNGGTDTTPHSPYRPEARGEVGALIDVLHELFAHDRTVASRGDSTRCGICYLHFPLNTLEYREAEGFFVCEACKRSLGHQQVTMIRRQQASHGG
ncbi:MAG TPA: hypothetical protein VFN11_18245 [Ktedonobacterales bacterium]|nr:hypothetical protein [Ktedonobacterales bacterium]